LLTGRFALTGVAAAAAVLFSTSAAALGLGRLSVQSGLGEKLQAEIDITSLSSEEASSLRARVAPPEAYRAAGVDYNAVLSNTQASLQRRSDGRPYLRISSDRTVQEPFVDVILELNWASGRLVREYTLLFDPIANRAAAPAPVTPPAMSAAPVPAPAAPPVARPAPAPAPAVAAAPAAPRATATPRQTPSEYEVKSGDTLYRIALRLQQPGVSLDQMLVALYRGNPQAFMDNNMNRLKAGSVLTAPTPDAARAVATPEAQQIIRAQSADFGAYRERLASGVPAAPPATRARQAGGKVQAAVEDRKPASPTPDKLTLSKGAAAASAPEAGISREREQKETSTRVAELSKNVEELRKLSGAASAVAAAPAPAPAPAPAAPPPPPAPTPAPAPAAAPAPEPSPTPAPTVVAQAPTAQPKPTPAEAEAKPPVAQQPDAGESLLDNPLVLPGAGVLLALLAGFGFYRLRSKAKKDSGETSFLESRLQPDSFFGASGGQRIDTRDAAGTSSSMSYSLSQLDAIGDVDPVAEADVYLAYGRDLQAEEILKEAMRASPERLAVRTKLLEVYAKRRDTKGYELLATQLYTLTHGVGEDWAKAQEMGLQIDPENPLYQPGGEPAIPAHEGQAMVEPLGASTMPQSVLPSPSNFDSTPFSGSKSGVDLDLDLGSSDAMRADESAADSQPLPTADFSQELPTFDAAEDLPRAAPAAETMPDLGMDFDLSGLASPAPAPAAVPPEASFESIDLEDLGAEGVGGGDDPLSRKLELAEEFRQIGDTEGARDLLQEVIAKASGPLKSKAQGMLDELA
jgi:pilus assembly protein FimV